MPLSAVGILHEGTMIRVLNIVPNLANGGIEATIMNTYRNLDRSKIQFDFLVMIPDRQYYDDEIEALGGKIYRIPGFVRHPFKNMRLRKKILKQYEIVELHAMHVWRFGYCKDAKRCGVKHMIFHVHNAQVKKGLFARHARKVIIKYSDEIVTCSQYAAEQMLGKRADEVILNGIDVEKYTFDSAVRKELRAHYGISDTAYVVGHVGRFADQKNHAFLVDSFALAASQRSDLYLMLKGWGALKEEIVAKVHALKIEDRVIFADDHDASALYSTFDLFVLPSIYEGLPVVAIEAQANGLPILLSDVITRESSIGGDVGYLSLDKQIWAEAMTKDRPRAPIADFAATGYDIKTVAQKRQEEYLRMVEHD